MYLPPVLNQCLKTLHGVYIYFRIYFRKNVCRARQEEIFYIVGPASRKSHSSLVLKSQDGYGEENGKFF